jgi:hypothetical protein
MHHDQHATARPPARQDSLRTILRT